MTEQKNEIVLSEGAALGNQLSPGLFKDIDFNGLNNALENMATASGELTPEDKHLARDIIDQWNHGVIDRLRDKENEMHGFVTFFNANSHSLYLTGMDIEEFGPEIAAKTNTKDLFQKVMETRDELEKHQDTFPEQPEKSASTTFEQEIKDRKEHEAAVAIYHMNTSKFQKKHAVAVGDWKRKMNESVVVQDLLTQAKKTIRGAKKMYQSAGDKANLAKLNISISSKAGRDALKELLTFTENI